MMLDGTFLSPMDGTLIIPGDGPLRVPSRVIEMTIRRDRLEQIRLLFLTLLTRLQIGRTSALGVCRDKLSFSSEGKLHLATAPAGGDRRSDGSGRPGAASPVAR